MTKTNIKKSTVYQYTLETYEIEGQNKRFFFSQYNNKAKKDYNKHMYTYYFSNQDDRDSYVSKIIKNINSWEENKKSKRENRKTFTNPAKVGDILVDSWGYDQTNVDFYQVIRLVGKQSVEMTEISSRFADRSTGDSMAAYVIPIPNSFCGEAKIVRALPASDTNPNQYCVKTHSYSHATLWNGKSQYCSWYA